MRFFISVLLILNSAFGFGQTAEFSVDKAVHKFPKTQEGAVLEHVFRVKNTGDAPLIISDYKVACSCTSVDLPKAPILPGSEYQLKVRFDTNGKYYFQDRLIYLKTNTREETQQLRIKVNVVPKS